MDSLFTCQTPSCLEFPDNTASILSDDCVPSTWLHHRLSAPHWWCMKHAWLSLESAGIHRMPVVRSKRPSNQRSRTVKKTPASLNHFRRNGDSRRIDQMRLERTRGSSSLLDAVTQAMMKCEETSSTSAAETKNKSAIHVGTAGADS